MDIPLEIIQWGWGGGGGIVLPGQLERGGEVHICQFCQGSQIEVFSFFTRPPQESAFGCGKVGICQFCQGS